MNPLLRLLSVLLGIALMTRLLTNPLRLPGIDGTIAEIAIMAVVGLVSALLLVTGLTRHP